MKIKKIFVCLLLVVITVVSTVGCGKQEEVSTPEDIAVRDKMVGGWILSDGSGGTFDATGMLTSFDVYEFTETKMKYHIVYLDTKVVESHIGDEYSIVNNKMKVTKNGKTQYSGVSFTDDGQLVLSSNSSENKFTKLTDEDIQAYSIPIGKTLSSEIDGATSEQEAPAETAAETATTE